MIKKIKQLVIIIAIFALAMPISIFASTPPSPPVYISGTAVINRENASGKIVLVAGVSATVKSDGTYSILIPSENIDSNIEYEYKLDGIIAVTQKIENPTQEVNLSITTADPEPTPNPTPPSGGGSPTGNNNDSIPPTNTSIIINNDDETVATTSVVLTLSADEASKMMIANDSNFTGAEWENYSITKNWVLTEGNGEKTVYAKFKDTSENTSDPIQDLIILSSQVVVLGVQSDYRTIQLEKILSDSSNIYTGDADLITTKLKINRNPDAEVDGYNKYTTALIKGVDGLEQSNIYAITNFTVYGTETTIILGAGERAGVINSYKSAFGKLPTTESEWQDVIKIANGRWPTERSATAEANAKKEFKKVYLREPNMENPNDNAAVTIIAYGLRSDVRNLDSEKTGILTFKHIYGYNPTSAIDWDIVRAIAYSGATR